MSRKEVLAIAAVIDIAMNAGARPVSAKALAARHRLPPRHLEPVLQVLVHVGILRGIRGPHGGYELARQHHAITAEDILRAAGSAEETDAAELQGSPLIDRVVGPVLAEAEHVLYAALARINVDDMLRRAEALK